MSFSTIANIAQTALGNLANSKALGVQPAKEAAPQRVVYVLHSGMRDPDNYAAGELKKALLKRGVKEKDIIIMPAVYPDMVTDPTSKNLGKGIKDNIRIFKESSSPDSKVSQKACQDFLDAMKKAGVKPTDKTVWVGHSAGGQMGFTVSKQLGDNTDNKNPQKYQFDTIVTLGSPIAKNQVPQVVKIRHYTSESDLIQTGTIGGTVGKAIPDNLDDNDRIRVFNKIGHVDFYKDTDPAIVDRIISETRPELPNPVVLLGASLPTKGLQMGGLLLNGLERGTKTTYEGNKGVETPDNATTIRLFGSDVSLLGVGNDINSFFKKMGTAPATKAKGVEWGTLFKAKPIPNK